ncbi:MAG TPA: PilW family protein, partial [Steroidobacteraceae bacterium]
MRHMKMSPSNGLSLVELMVALVIGSIIVLAALTLHAQSRANYRVSETIARLQEKGRFAFAALEADIELAGYYGFATSPRVFRLVRDGNPNLVIAESDQLRQFPVVRGGALPAAISGVPGGVHACGVNFAVDVQMPVQVSDNAFALGRDRTEDCEPYRKNARVGSDALTLRRISTREVGAESGRLQAYVTRFLSQSVQYLFADGLPPGPINDDAQVHDLLVRTYYVAEDSVDRAGVPALRVKSLSRVRGTVGFDEDEVMPGIEDLQVELGIRDPQTNARRYVTAGFADLAWQNVMAVRVWLRVRADDPEAGYLDTKTYRYA